LKENSVKMLGLGLSMGDLQDPIHGAIVPYVRPYFAGIFPEI